MNLEYLLEHKLIPAGTKTIDLNDPNVVQISDLESSRKNGIRDPIVVVDGATWVAKGREKQGSIPYYSGIDDGTSMYFWLCHRNRFHERQVIFDDENMPMVNPEGTTDISPGSTTNTLTKTQIKEDNTMNKMNDDERAVAEELNAALGAAQSATQAAKPGQANTSHEFTPNTEKVEKSDAPLTMAQEATQKIRAAHRAELPNTDNLVRFMRMHARHVGFVTANDDQLMVSVKKAKMTVNGVESIKDDAESQRKAKECREANKKIPISICNTVDTLEPKHKAPSKILGAVAKLPKGGMVPWSALTLGGAESAVQFKEDTTEVTLLLPINEYYSVITNYCRGKIKEDPTTYGEHADTLEVVYRAAQAKADGNESLSQASTIKPLVARPVARVASKRSLLMPGAYMPISVYKTLPYASITKQPDIDLANQSMFGDYVRGINAFAPYNAASPAGVYSEKYNTRLNSEQKAQIKVELRDGNPVIVSNFFKAGGGQTPLTVATYYDKNKTLQDIEIPVKEAVMKKDGTGARWSLQRINALSKDLSPEDKAKSSLVAEKFKKFREAAGEAVSEDKLRKLTKRAGTGGTVAKNEIAMDAVSALYFGKVDTVSLAGVDTQSMKDKITEMFNDVVM